MLASLAPFIAPDVLVPPELFIVLGVLVALEPLAVESVVEPLVAEPLVAASFVVDVLFWLELEELFSCTSPPVD